MVDLFTGCFEGGVYVCSGKQAGGFAPPVAMLDRDGRLLRLGQFWDDVKDEWTGVADSKWKAELGIGVAAVDWDDDGDLDLVLGSNGGGLFVRKNVGTATKAVYELDSEAAQSTAAASAAPASDATEPTSHPTNALLTVPGDHLIPAVADWDGDGRFDVLSGSGSGGVYWFRNVGKKGAPKFEAAKALLEPSVDHGSIT